MASVTVTQTMTLTEAAPTHEGMLPAERLMWERDEARALAQALSTANQRMEHFLGIAAHEIRTPVTSSRLGVRLAARRLDLVLNQIAPQDHDVLLAGQLVSLRDLLAAAEADLERLVRLVGDLLDVSRLRTGQLAVHPARANLPAIVRAAVDEQRQLAPTRRIRFHLPARQVLSVWVDADRIHQVVTNYLTNALKYSPADRPVDVRVRQDAGWARVSVCDHGPGIEAEEQERMWEPFHRVAGIPVVSGRLHASAQSLGLGLYLCKTIIEQHHGQVGVESSPGHGSTFWFALPVLPGIRFPREESLPSTNDAA